MNGVNFALFIVVSQGVDDLTGGPIELEHNLDEIHESDRAVFDWLSCPTSEKDLLDLGWAWVELESKLDAFLNKRFLSISEHFTNHLPCYVD